jgi:DNA-directed RNA polymerase specialized sigma subunit
MLSDLSRELEQVEYLKSPSLDGMPCSSGVNDSTYQIVQKKIDILEKRIAVIRVSLEQAEEIIAKAELMLGSIDTVTEYPEWRVIELRYFIGMDWRKIAEELHYSESQIYRIHDRALSKIADRWK